MPALPPLFSCLRPWGVRLGWLALWAWGSACLWLPPAWADPRSLAAAPRTHLSVVIDDNYPPYIFRQQDGQLVGYLVDLWQLWQQHTGIQVQLLASDWSLAQERMARGEADVIDTLFRTPEREQRYLFSRPYADVPVAIYVHRDIGGIHDAATLRGLVVGVKAADACVRQLNSMGVTSQLAFESYEKIIAAAITGRVKVFCLDEPPANYLLYRSGAQESFLRVLRLYEGQFHRAVRLHDAALLQQMEQGFDRISPTELASLRDKWFGTPVGSVRLDAATLRHILLALAATLLLGVLAAAWSVLLRRQVRARTRELQAERARLHTLLDMLPDLVWLKDEQGLYRACNRALEQFLGRTERDIIGHSDEQLLGPEHAALVRKLDRQALSSGEAQTVEETLFSPGLQRSTVLETIKKPLLDAQGQPIGVIGVARDITVRRAYEDAQRLAARVLECIADVVVILDAQGRVQSVNPACTETLGYLPSDVLGLLPRAWRSGRHDDAFYDAQWHALQHSGQWQGEVWIRRKNGQVFPSWQTVSAVRNEAGEVTHYVLVISDISTVKHAQEALAFLAHHDALTRLPNRLLLRDRLAQALARASREGQPLALLFIDLNRFKEINDTLGHAVGDAVLMHAAQVMASALRASDTLARLGGDEFVALLEGEASEHSVQTVVEKLGTTLAQPFQVQTHQLQISASIGVARFPDDGQDVDTLLHRADTAMYEVKLRQRQQEAATLPPLPPAPCA